MNSEVCARSYVLSRLATGIMLLFMGGMLYVLYRPQTLLLFHVANGMGLTDVIGRWRLTASETWQPTEFVVYCLPAGLWAMSYVLIVGTLAQELPLKRRWMAVAVIPVLGAASELLQAMSIIPGTFDWADLALYILPLIIYATINNKRHGKLFYK